MLNLPFFGVENAQTLEKGGVTMKGGPLTMDYWFAATVFGQRNEALFDKMYSCLEREPPTILSVVGERGCNLQCAHCIFQREESGAVSASDNDIAIAARTILKQMGPGPLVVHEGRVFRPEHLHWLFALREERPDAAIGMIDNGTYLRHADVLRLSGFKFDWLDISIDGPERVHNRQRRSSDSFSVAMEGIARASDFLNVGGRISSLFTLTNVNASSILETCVLLPKEVDEWHITTLSPARPEIASLSVNTEEMREAWQQMKEAAKRRQVRFRIYYVDDLEKLAVVVGGTTMRKALAGSRIGNAVLQFQIDGVTVLFYPQSVSTNETFVLDSDCHYRAPYSIAYTLRELHEGVSRFGENIRQYTIGRVDGESDFQALYAASVWNWRQHFGQRALEREIALFDRIRGKEVTTMVKEGKPNENPHSAPLQATGANTGSAGAPRKTKRPKSIVRKPSKPAKK